MVASMVVFIDGRPSKQNYKRFKIEGLDDQDDYAAMQQVLRRRLTHFKNGDAGFDERPDALLIDGGIEHANAVLQVLNELGLAIPTLRHGEGQPPQNARAGDPTGARNFDFRDPGGLFSRSERFRRRRTGSPLPITMTLRSRRRPGASEA